MIKLKKKKLTYFSRGHLTYAPLIVVLILIFGRLVYLQTFEADALNAKGITNRTISQTLLPVRGIIYDSKGNVLSRSILTQEIYADPKTLTQLINKHQYTKMSKDDIAKTVGGILDQDSKPILDKLNKNVQWTSLAHQVDLEKTNKIRKLNIPGFGFADESKRIYPQNTWASSVLGFVNQTGHGIGGIEAYYDKFLFGSLGRSTSEETSRHQIIPFAPSKVQAPHQGDNLTLTLNTTIQSLIEQQLTALKKTTQAKSVTILAMDPHTGRILGMGTKPTFDPNNYAKVSPDNWRNRAISMNYEPGSTFKIVTGSAAIEERLIPPIELFADPGYLKVENRTIMNWEYGIRPAGSITFMKAMELSSNVVLSQVGLKLGVTNFYSYLRAFGFGTKTGIDIAGEESGLIVPERKVKDVELATMSFGQSNMVTPIQLITALSAIANGGRLYKTYVVDKITAPDGKTIQQNQPIAVRKVISKATSYAIISINSISRGHIYGRNMGCS